MNIREDCLICRHFESKLCKQCDLNNEHQFGDRSTMPGEGYAYFFERDGGMSVWLKNRKFVRHSSPRFNDIWWRLFHLSETEKSKLNNIGV